MAGVAVKSSHTVSPSRGGPTHNMGGSSPCTSLLGSRTVLGVTRPIAIPTQASTWPRPGMLASGHGGRKVRREDGRCCRASPRSLALDDDNCCAHCVRLPAKERLLSWKRMRLWKESGSCCKMCPLTEVLRQRACATAFGTTFLPIAVGLCARLPTVSTTGLPAASGLGFVGRDFQCERTRTLLKNLLPHDCRGRHTGHDGVL